MSPFDLPGRQSRHQILLVLYNHKPGQGQTASPFCAEGAKLDSGHFYAWPTPRVALPLIRLANASMRLATSLTASVGVMPLLIAS